MRLRIRFLRHLQTSVCLLAALSACSGPARSARETPSFARFGVAKFGEADPLAVLERLKGWGFDYAEPALSQVTAMSDADFETLVARVRAAGIPVEAANWFVPKELKITGPEADPGRIRAYVAKALARAERLGVRIVVFGSGGARAVPEGFPADRAWAQLREFVRLCASEIDRNGYGMTLAVEALPPTVTNVVLTLREALRLAREADHPRVRIVYDFDNMAVAGDDPDVILEAAGWIVHVHFANTHQGRVYPKDEAEDPRYRRVFGNLRRIGYRGRISLEANSTDLAADAPAGAAFLRRMIGRD